MRRQTRRIIAGSAMFIAACLILLAAHRHRQIAGWPLVRVDQIGPCMNFARVRVEGMLESDARRLANGSILYFIDDGTGTLPVFRDRAPDADMPPAGERIGAEGILLFGRNRDLRMRAYRVERSTLLPSRPDPGDDTLSSVVLAEPDTWRTVRGEVVRLGCPGQGSNAPHRIILRDASGELEVVHWLELERPPAVGDWIEARGKVGRYKGRAQLKVIRSADVRIVEGG